MCASTHPLADPAYRNIGNRTLIRDREEYRVPIPPGGTLGEYIPFYFGGHSPMLLNIKGGRQGVERIPQRDCEELIAKNNLSIKMHVDINHKYFYP